MHIKQTIKKISSSITKITLVFVVISTIIILFSAFTSGDKITINPEETAREQRKEIYALINNPQYQKTNEGKIGVAIYRTMLCGAIGEACTDNPEDGDENYNRSIFGFVGNLMVMPYANPPASGMYFAYDSLKNAGFIPRAYAAEGIGFASIKPMIGIWKAFRNVAYLILVLVLVLIGFMIMFRMKLNPQTVISVENTLPRIVMSLIFITFSFAIAGFLIDLMYVTIAVAINVISKTQVNNEPIFKNALDVQNRYMTAGLIDLWPHGVGIGGWSFLNTFKSAGSIFGIGNSFINILPRGLEIFVRGILAIPAILLFKHWIYKPFDTILDNLKNLPAIGSIFSILKVILELILIFALSPLGAGIIVGILFLFTLLFLIVRIFFMLLISYVKILLLIIFSPLILLFEVIPGKKSFAFWSRSLIGELLTFPLIIIFFLVGYMITSTAFSSGTTLFKPPFLFGLDQKAFASILGMGIVLVIPQLVKMIKELMGIKALPDIKPGFFSGAAVAAGGALGLFSQFSTLTLGLPGLREKVFRFLPGPWRESAEEAAKRLAQEKQRGE
ncbi:MAG TPA: hypothetical protein VJH96_00940 [Patescibacteria group bacterium]|nr:hypothetical protein [Patescibacteria group bacterium]